MMEVQFVVLECGILVIGWLRSFLFDVCVKCAVGMSEAVRGTTGSLATANGASSVSTR